jgi:hemolysin activation/secretion protein
MAAAAAKPTPQTNRPVFAVSGYQVRGLPALPTNSLAALLAKYTGPTVSEDEMVKAALDVQAEYQKQGLPAVSVAFAPKAIEDGMLTLNLFEAPSPQVLVAGSRYTPPPKTNPPAKFPVHAYEVTGDTLLSDEILTEILGDYTGTNIGVAEILKAGSELQMEYRDRGYPTVNVTIPPQQITNGIVKIRVFEGELASITVTNNRFFSSNNVVRSLPSLRTNEVLLGPLFQTELDRANANQDRQIYPQLTPGPRENTTALILDVRDRLPLHGKLELNNQSSPGTPETRVNSSAAYNNLWQLEHSVGVQYSFSPEDYKIGEHWPFYDRPLVANYSGYYRLPLGDPEAVANALTIPGGNFGYDEATRKFRLPSPSNRPEMNFYASRSTIDTGVQTIVDRFITGSSNTFQQIVQKDITINSAVGARLSLPMPSAGAWQSAFSFGADFKSYQLTSHKTNIIFQPPVVITNAGGTIITNAGFTIPTPTPLPDGLTAKSLDYLPLSLRYDGSLHDALGITSFGLGLSLNAWYSGSLSNLHNTSGSTNMHGSWIILTPSISRDFVLYTNWTLSLRVDGQIASEPLISNEQFGAGGVNSVRGYREGEVFGDDGWHVSIEEKTPAYIIGPLGARQRLAVRGSIFMDYAEAYLLDPQGQKSRIPLWGVGAGVVISLGNYWDARLIFSEPLLSAGSTKAYQPRFNFAVTGQF